MSISLLDIKIAYIFKTTFYMTNKNETVGDDVVEIITTKKDIWPQNVESHFISLLEEEVKKG